MQLNFERVTSQMANRAVKETILLVAGKKV